MPGERGPEPRRTLAVLLNAAVALSVAACAPRVTVAIPGGDSRPDPGAEAAFDAATSSCRVLRSRSMELALAGRVRDQVVRGTVQAATTTSGDLRLEGVAPFGAPLFVLVSSGERASLLLPREARVLRDEPTVDVLEALVGLRLTAADLHALLTGCVVSAPAVRGGRAYGSDWWAVDIGPRQSAFLRRSPTPPRVEAARLDSLDIGYTAFNATSPREVMLVAPGAAGTPGVRLRVRLGQVEDNPALPAEAFRLDASPGATPLPLDELQARGLRLGSTR
jgi:hypothetical protein